MNEFKDLVVKSLQSIVKAYEESEIGIKECDDCVSRQAVLDEVRAIATWHSGDAFNEDRVITHIKMLSSVTPKRERGGWVEYNYKVGDHSCDFWGIYCNRCLKKYTTFHSLKNPNYCPNCGAEMR